MKESNQLQSLSDRIVSLINEHKYLPIDIDLLCYCHQTVQNSNEIPCAKLRNELNLTNDFPLVISQSGSLSFIHALILIEWMFSSGLHSRAMCVIGDYLHIEDIHYNVISLIEVSVIKGDYKVDSYSVSAEGVISNKNSIHGFQFLASDPFIALTKLEQERPIRSAESVPLVFYAPPFGMGTIVMTKGDTHL